MNFEMIKLGEISDITKLAGFEFTKHINYIDDGEIIALRALNLRKGELDLTDIKRIDKGVSESLTRSKLYINDILLTYTGNGYGDCAMITENDKYHLAPNICKISPNSDRVDPYFLYSYIRSNSFYQTMSSNMTGSSQPTIPMKTIRILEVPLPPLELQKKIGSVIKSIDEKIRTNTQINRNLSEQGSAIIKEVFARSDGKIQLGDILDFYGGFAFKSSTYLEEGCYKILTIKNVQDGYIDTSGCAYIDELPVKIKAEQILSVGDVLLSLTGNVGRTGIVCSDNLLLNQRVAKIKASKERIPFIYFLLREPSVKNKMELIARGTAQANLSPIETLKLEVEYSAEAESDYQEILSSIFTEIINNTCENRILSDLRDTLLPKLMSGELDVSDLEI